MNPDELQLFSQLVESIYDASLDAALWPRALELACVFVQGCSAFLFYRSVGNISTSLFYSWGENLDYFNIYQEKFSSIDPFFPAILFLEIGKVHSTNDLLPEKEFRETRLYREWAQPQGLLDAVHSNLERTSTGAAAMVIRRKECDGLFDEAAKARFELIVPHVRRAVAIGKVVEFHRASEAALSQTLERLDAGVLLVAPDGRLIHVNQKAAAMLAAAELLSAPHGRLTATDPRANVELQEAIAAAARGDAGLGERGIAISLRCDDRTTSLVIHVLSLTSGNRRNLLPGQATAALFVREMTLAAPAPLEIMVQLYRLTAAEVRVVAALSASSGVADMAKTLGIGEATVKSHLHRVFAKTGTKRQADVIKLLARHGSALS